MAQEPAFLRFPPVVPEDLPVTLNESYYDPVVSPKNLNYLFKNTCHFIRKQMTVIIRE